jgi:hypothetical protein
MSVRRREAPPQVKQQPLSMMQTPEMKNLQLQVAAAGVNGFSGGVPMTLPDGRAGVLMPIEAMGGMQQVTYNDLTPEQQAAASLGVSPNDLKPIEWMNKKHHENLVSANALGGDLARRIEAFKKCSTE